MKRVLLPVLAAAFGSSLLLVGDLTAQTEPAQAVAERQDLMKKMGGSFRPIVAVARDESTDLEAAKAAAQTIHDSAIAALERFVAGTAQGEAEGSRARPEVWTDADDFKARAVALADAAAVVAGATDIQAVKAGLQPLADACGGCHEGRGSAGGKYRFPK